MVNITIFINIVYYHSINTAILIKLIINITIFIIIKLNTFVSIYAKHA